MTDNYVAYDGPVVTRQFAKENNLKRYFTGNPCKHGHVSERATSNKTCCQCLQDKNEKYAQEGYFRNRMKDKIAADPDGMRARWKMEKIIYGAEEWRRKDREQNREKYRKAGREWARKNPEKVRAKRNNRKKAFGKITANQISDMMLLQKFKCNQCKSNIKELYHVDHVMPIKLGGGNTINNIQLLCPTCNLRKGAKHPIDWAQENGRLL